MAVRIAIDAARGLVIVTVTGELSDETLLEIPAALHANPELRPESSLLVDLSGAEGRRVTSAGVRRLAEQPLYFAKSSRRAVVVPSDLGFGVARMYDLLRDASGGGVRVYRDRAEAEAWLLGG
jgi:hypothetical protein